jgi:hypothetical protein
MAKVLFALGSAGLVRGDGECCLTCEAPLIKYYSVDEPHGHCGESCMDPNSFDTFKIFEPNLTIADGSTGYKSCADLGWPIYRETVTHGVWPLRVTLDLYDRSGATLKSGTTCSLYDIQDGSCAQSDLDCAYVPEAKLFRGSLTDGTCAAQGYTVKTGEQTITVPFLGDITATTYSKPVMVKSGSICSLYAIQDGECGQSDLDCAYVPEAKIFQGSLTDGTCAAQGYTVKTGEQTITVPFLGDITATTYSKPAILKSGSTCSLYAIQDGECGQSDLDCAYVPEAKLFQGSLTDGTCAAQGYTVKTGEQTITVPFLGDITATTYSKPAILGSGSTCSLYAIQDGECAQSDLNCAYVPEAKLFQGSLTDGTCAAQGYTVKTGEQTITVPFLGDIIATTYAKPAILKSGSTCSLYAIQDGECGQSDLDCAYVPEAKLFQGSLTDGTCAAQGYTVKTGEQTITVPFLGDITATTYSKPALLKSGSTCSLYAIQDGECAQSDLDCAYVPEAKIFQGSLTDGTCAAQGYTVKTGEQTITVPFLGDIVATTYSKPIMLV